MIIKYHVIVVFKKNKDSIHKFENKTLVCKARIDSI